MGADLVEVHRTQQSFRAVMNAMAHPGRIEKLQLSAHDGELEKVLGAPLATLVSIFVDQAVTFAVAEKGGTMLAETIAAETHAHPTMPSQAAYEIVLHAADEQSATEAIAAASGGSLASPERGATILLGCECLVAGQDDCAQCAQLKGMQWVSVEGPGVRDTSLFAVDRTDWVRARSQRDDEFPCGIDIVLVDRSGQVLAVPRTSLVSLFAEEGEAL